MALFPFETQLVISSEITGLVVKNAQVTIYATTDTNLTSPLALVDPKGLPISNPMTSTAEGFLPPFQATQSQVMWSGDGYIGYLSSYQGLLTAALAAQAAAESATTGGGQLPTGGADGQILGRAAGAPLWINPANGSVEPGDVDSIVSSLINSGVGATVGSMDTRYKKLGVVPVDDLPAGSTVVVRKSGASWPARPTSRSDIIVFWVGADPDPAIISSGTGGALNNVDIRMAI